MFAPYGFFKRAAMRAAPFAKQAFLFYTAGQ